MGNAIQRIQDWFRPDPPDDPTDGLDLPARFCGYAAPNHALETDPHKLAHALGAARLNLTLVEVDSATPDIWNRLLAFLHAMRNEKIWTIICGNWNTAAFANAPEAWFRDLENFLKEDIGPRYLGTEISEWSDARNNGPGMARKAESWAHRLGIIGPLRLWNRGSRPQSAPAGWLLDYHIPRHGVLGPAGCLVNGDHSDWLRWVHDGPRESLIAIPDRVRQSANSALDSGRHYLFYGYQHCANGAAPDWQTIEILGQIFSPIANPKSKIEIPK
ncbi:MAG: hypothetical protein HY343_07520 [Lentisphaerae bacterium]|nr:hypothetical protein [Lentisphaerota bacterium]